MKQLENLRWSPSWITHLGCVKGCLDWLDIDLSDGWLHGGTGHAFIINMHEVVCPSGPTAWKSMKLLELGANLGYKQKALFGFKGEGNLPELQEKAWNFVQREIDAEHPCYGWELRWPEFYVVYGYDDVGYYYSGAGCDEGAGPKPWQELGDTGIGVVEMYSIRPGEAVRPSIAVRAALEFALEFAEGSDDYMLPKYHAGLDGFDHWIRAVEEATASRLGMGYNAVVWHECRTHAAAFLEEAGERIELAPSRLFDDALAHYREVARILGKVVELYPMKQVDDDVRIESDERIAKAAANLKCARDAEAAGLETLAELLEALGGPLDEE